MTHRVAILGGPGFIGRYIVKRLAERGDVMAVGKVLYVGQSARTNHAGLKQLAHAVLEHGYRVKAAEVRGALHLKSACTHLGRSTLLVNRAWIEPVFPAEAIKPAGLGDKQLTVDEFPPFGGRQDMNLMRADGGTVIGRGGERVLAYVTPSGVRAAGFELRAGDQARMVEWGLPASLVEWEVARAPRA